MRGLPWIGALSALGLLLSGPVPAAEQSDAAPPPAASSTDQPAPAAGSTVQSPVQSPGQPPTSVVVEQPPATISGPGSANLVVAAVKPKNGWRASKLIGSAVFNDQNQKIGSIDDLIVAPDAKVAIAVISVGGFLGMGSKLVAVPYEQLRFEAAKDNGERIQLPGGSKESLNAMPNFTYGNT